MNKGRHTVTDPPKDCVETRICVLAGTEREDRDGDGGHLLHTY